MNKEEYTDTMKQSLQSSKDFLKTVTKQELQDLAKGEEDLV